MEAQERQLVLDQLASSEERLLGLVEGLTPDQWNFRETPARWSIAENIEHVIVVESAMMRVIAKALRSPPEPEKKFEAGAKDAVLLQVATVRTSKMDAPEGLHPAGKWTDFAETIAELRRVRAASVAYATETTDDLHDHFFSHMKFGDLSCYQWLVLMGQHAARHAAQIERIKADPAYPS